MRIVLTILLVLVIQRQSFAQRQYNAAVLRESLNGNDGYKARSADDRYEGLYNPNFAGENFSLVSLTTGEVSYNFNTDQTLSFQLPEGISYNEIGISGISYGLDIHYHLDFAIKKREIKRVPLNTLLRPKHIFSDNLGLFGYIGDPENPDLYIPINTINAGALASKIFMVLQSKLPLDKIIVNTTKKVNGVFRGYKNLASVDDIFVPNTPFLISFPIPKKTDLSDVLNIDIQCFLKGKKEPVKMLNFNMLVP